MGRNASRPGWRSIVTAALGILFIAAVVRRLRIAAGMRRKDQAVIDRKRKRNKRFANKAVNRIGRAGRPHSVFAMIRYTGRRSGRGYATPVRVLPRPDGFIVPLTYGPRTGWYANLRSCGGVLEWQGRTYPVSDPSLVPADAVVPQLPLLSRFLIWLDGTDQFVHLRTEASLPA